VWMLLMHHGRMDAFRLGSARLRARFPCLGPFFLAHEVHTGMCGRTEARDGDGPERTGSKDASCSPAYRRRERDDHVPGLWLVSGRAPKIRLPFRIETASRLRISPAHPGSLRVRQGAETHPRDQQLPGTVVADGPCFPVFEMCSQWDWLGVRL
jgi:hypothetical protein